MKAIRYEFENGKGIFRHRTEISLSTLIEIGKDIDDNLPLPEVVFDYDCKFYFTQKGNDRFIDTLNNLINLFNSHNIKVIKCETELDDNDIIYKDDYQVAIENIL